jgi:hypothetical protein
MRLIAPYILIVAMTLLSGCARGNVELLEARLRNREDELLRLDSQLAQAKQELARSERERDLLQQQLVSSDHDQLQFEVSRSLARIEGLNIDSRLTGILENRETPGTRELNLLFAPVDANEEPVKLEGRTVIELYDLSAPSTQPRLHTWEFTPQETAATWHSGFIGEGFQFALPVPPPTEAESLVINVSFETPDGRRFHATHEMAGGVTNPPPRREINEPPPLPLSADADRSKTQQTIPAGDARELDTLPPAYAKRIPLDELCAPE